MYNVAIGERQHAKPVERMQHQLAMRVVHAFRIASGAGGVEQGRARVLIEVGEFVRRITAGEQRLVFPVPCKVRRHCAVVRSGR